MNTTESPRSGGRDRQLMVMMGLVGLVVLALGVGFIGGYVTGGSRVPQQVSPQAATPVAAPAGGMAGHPPGVACVYDLAPKDQWILAGMTCNCKEANCNRTPLLMCHCDTAHSMKALTKQLLVEGTDPKSIGAELEKKFGPGIRPGT